jgi:2-polyprenyl-6-methoxyphenol hydroxylase-like FAD-dependent oxidoreductase
VDSRNSKRITVAGAGIGGLTAAIALHRAGHAVTVLERAPAFAPVGAGIVLAPNAVRILTSLGVDLTRYGAPILRLQVRDAAGAMLQEIDLSRLPECGPILACRRGDLHEALLAALPPAVVVRLGTPFPDAATAADVVVGADGIHSSVRESLYGALPLRYSGVTCWRAICPNPGVREAAEYWGGETGAPPTRVGIVPLTENRLYVFLVQTAPPGTPRQNDVAAIRASFAHYADPVPAVLEALAGIPLLHHDLGELDEPRWGRGSVVLIGDAAHAMTPNQGQGASAAIEDAVVLPRAVIASLNRSDPASHLAALREKRVRRIHRESRLLGQVAHWRSPPGVWLRNALLRAMPRVLAEQHYRRLVGPGILLAG